eukprot:3022517-Prymnesium_polylepis.1
MGRRLGSRLAAAAAAPRPLQDGGHRCGGYGAHSWLLRSCRTCMRACSSCMVASRCSMPTTTRTSSTLPRRVRRITASIPLLASLKQGP